MVMASRWSWVTRMVVTPRRWWSSAQLQLHVLAQLGVKGGKRLVQQEEPGLDRQRPGDGDPLALTAR